MYHTPNTTLIGEVLVRFSKDGDFELTVSKGPGITLLSLRQDATFAEVKGGLAGHGWSGPVTKPRRNCAVGLGCEINSFTRRTERLCDTPPATRRSCSGFKEWQLRANLCDVSLCGSRNSRLQRKILIIGRSEKPIHQKHKGWNASSSTRWQHHVRYSIGIMASIRVQWWLAHAH